MSMPSLRSFLITFTLASLAGAGGAAAQQPAKAATPPGQQLPNGASSISETYGELTVNCRLLEGQKQCLLAHAQGNSQTGQRYFALELKTPKDGKTEGTILMPFGLKLDSGVVLKLDDKDLNQGLHFSTCLPQGCLVPVSLPAATTDAMKKGKTLTVASLNQANGEVVTFNVPLDGFAAATARVADLSK
jgi:invasion protein IalB